MTPPSFWQLVVLMLKGYLHRLYLRVLVQRGWWGFDRLPRRERAGLFTLPLRKGARHDVAALFQPKRDRAALGIATPWCEEHNLPMRLMSFGTHDRIVCWLPWLYPDEARFGIRTCIEGSRIVSPPLDSHPPLTG